MLSMSKDHCSPPDIRNVSDDRIYPQLPKGRITRVESTVDGDVVIIDPSFEDSIHTGSSNHSSSREHAIQIRESQVRSPQQDRKTIKDNEERNPCSPGDQLETSSHHRRHTRNLSTLFDATSIGRNNSVDSGEIYIDDEFLLSGLDRKHKRDMSNSFAGHSSVHRRLNSIGTSQNVHRRQGHQREDSLGLDILSAAVEASQDELAQAAGEQGLPRRPNLEPRPTNQHVYHRRPYSSHPHTHQPTHSLVPPYGRHYVGPQAHGTYLPAIHNGYTHTSYLSNVVPSYYAPNYVPRQGQGFPMQQYPTQHSMHPPPPAPPKSTMYPPEKRSYPQDISDVRSPTKSAEWTSSNSAPSFSSIDKNPSINSIKQEASTTAPSKSHHRHLSSLGSMGMGNILSASIMSPGAEHDVLPSITETKPHHRSTSSVSFLNSLDVCGIVGSADETFLRNLQEASNNAYQSPTPMDGLVENTPITNDGSYSAAPAPTRSPNKLASGGTSKRIRRKCTVAGCINRVVQGGLCIAHGAKRKLCGHPGCTKNVKKAGLCSTHGPARKRCDLPGCSKVAVQGGRCIAHGAKKKLCEVHGCDKQAILTGMCKKHHDEHKGSSKTHSDNSGGGGSDGSVTSKKSCSMHKSNHTRGLSIFHEIPANEIESIINADSLRADPSLPATQQPRPPDNFW